jgi:hypothetical protein
MSQSSTRHFRCGLSLPAGLLVVVFLQAPVAALPSVATPAETMAAAAAALQNQDYSGAIRLLEPAMTGMQDRPSAWRSLGLAYLRLHQSRRSQEAYSKALALEPGSALPLLYLGIAASQLGQVDVAFEWLRKAKDTRRVDMTQLEIEPDLQGLKSDPRYADLLPRAADFARPFVEDVNIIREWDGESAGDQFGWIARVIGDADGDGTNDFVTSAPTKNIRGANAGRVYVYSGRSGALLWSVDGAPGDELGSGIEAAGDVNGDGIADVVASAPGIDTVYVYSGRDGRVLLTLHGEARGDRFGEHVASISDSSGHANIIVGAPANSAQGKGAGRAYIYSGKDGHLLLTLSGQRAGDAFGSTVAGSRDKTHRLWVVGAPGAGPNHTGRVYVYRHLSARPAFQFDADSSGVALGYMFVSVLGDVDGDNVPDIFASDWSDASKGPQTGKAYVYSGRSGQRLHTFTGATAGEGFGTTQSIAGDVNGDGRADLIIGSWQYSVAAQSAGRAYLYDGRNGQLLRTYTSRIPGDTFGFDAVGMGSLDGRGQSELLITAGWSGIHGHHSGRIFLISSGVPRRGGKP